MCPVYERIGGHAYGSIYPGPIGAILSPQLTGIKDHNDPNSYLPYASSLCGRCNEVCPVRIPIVETLLDLRNKKVEKDAPPIENALMQAMKLVWGKPQLWNAITGVVSFGRILGGFDGKIKHLPSFLSGWTDMRDSAVPPKKSFREWFDTEEAQELLRSEREHGLKEDSK